MPQQNARQPENFLLEKRKWNKENRYQRLSAAEKNAKHK